MPEKMWVQASFSVYVFSLPLGSSVDWNTKTYWRIENQIRLLKLKKIFEMSGENSDSENGAIRKIGEAETDTT